MDKKLRFIKMKFNLILFYNFFKKKMGASNTLPILIIKTIQIINIDKFTTVTDWSNLAHILVKK